MKMRSVFALFTTVLLACGCASAQSESNALNSAPDDAANTAVAAENAGEEPAKKADEAPAKAKIVDEKQLPQVLLQTSKGDVVLELYEDQAPNTVANFVNLVEKGFYDGLKFHRVLDKFMAQGGCPKGTGTGGPGYNIKCECYRPDAKKHERGVIAMAHAGKDTGGSQFYITFIAPDWLDKKHTVFGKVIKGMDNVDKFSRTEDRAAKPEVIK